MEGSGKYGVKDVVSGKEILPQSFDNIGYYYSGFFTAKDNTGVQLFDKDGKCVIPAQEQISAKEGYFEFTKGDTKGFYFIKEKSTVSGVYNKFEIDAAGNISFVKDGKYGVLNKKGEIVIPGEYELILWDGKNYNAAKNKNDKRPYFDARTKRFNWYLAEAAVFDADGKLVKKLTAPQAKKIFEAKNRRLQNALKNTSRLSGRRCFCLSVSDSKTQYTSFLTVNRKQFT